MTDKNKENTLHHVQQKINQTDTVIDLLVCLVEKRKSNKINGKERKRRKKESKKNKF